MTHEAARLLAERLQPLYEQRIVTVLSGLVKTATQEKEGKTIRFPVSFDTVTQPVEMKDADLVPDSRQRGILYFEGDDATVTRSEPNYTRYSANLRMVFWYNAKRYQLNGDHPESIHTALMAAVLHYLNKGPKVPTLLQAFQFEITRVVQDNLFSKYTYREEKSQFLLSPYYAFGIDLTATFQLNHNPICHDSLVIVDVNDC